MSTSRTFKRRTSARRAAVCWPRWCQHCVTRQSSWPPSCPSRMTGRCCCAPSSSRSALRTTLPSLTASPCWWHTWRSSATWVPTSLIFQNKHFITVHLPQQLQMFSLSYQTEENLMGMTTFREVLEKMLVIVVLPVRKSLRKEVELFSPHLVSNTCGLLASIVSELTASALGSEVRRTNLPLPSHSSLPHTLNSPAALIALQPPTGHK